METFKAIESVNFPGFYHVPGFSRYAVSKDGRVVNTIVGEELLGSTNPDGYHNFRLTSDLGYCYTYGRHRLLGDMFKSDTRIERGIINHINGIKGDDRLVNLEWTTFQGNVEHAGSLGLTTKCLPMSVRDYETGRVKNYPSAVECARDLGLTKDAVLYRLRVGEKRLFPEKKQYRLGHEPDPWYEIFSAEEEISKNGTSKSVLVRHLLTGTIKPYKKLSDLAWELGVSNPTLTSWLGKFGQPVLPGCIQIKWFHDRTPWREVEDPWKELAFAGGKRPVRTTNDSTGEVKNYPSSLDCAVENNLNATTLHQRLKSNGNKVFKDGLRYTYIH